MAAVCLIAEQAPRASAGDQTRSRHDVVALTLGDLERERKTHRVDYKVHLGRCAATRASDGRERGPPFAPAACWCARFVVLSMHCHSASTSVCSAPKSASQRPFFAHLSKRLNTVFQGPNSPGKSRHGTPVRRHQSTASKKRRSSLPGRPTRGQEAKTAATRAHCSSEIQDRVATSTFDHVRDPGASSCT